VGTCQGCVDVLALGTSQQMVGPVCKKKRWWVHPVMENSSGHSGLCKGLEAATNPRSVKWNRFLKS
jgi:hypothetical protein